MGSAETSAPPSPAAAAGIRSRFACRRPRTAAAPPTGWTMGPPGDSNVPGLLGPARDVWPSADVGPLPTTYASLAGTTIMMQGGNAIGRDRRRPATLNVSELLMSGSPASALHCSSTWRRGTGSSHWNALGRRPRPPRRARSPPDEREMATTAPIRTGASRWPRARSATDDFEPFGDCFRAPAIQLPWIGSSSPSCMNSTTGSADKARGPLPSSYPDLFPTAVRRAWARNRAAGTAA